jgi:hypothetical protein
MVFNNSCACSFAHDNDNSGTFEGDCVFSTLGDSVAIIKEKKVNVKKKEQKKGRETITVSLFLQL